MRSLRTMLGASVLALMARFGAPENVTTSLPRGPSPARKRRRAPAVNYRRYWGGGRLYFPNGKQEVARRLRQLAAGTLKTN